MTMPIMPGPETIRHPLTEEQPVLRMSCPSHADDRVTGYAAVRTEFTPGQPIVLTDVALVDGATFYGQALELVYAERERVADDPHKYAVTATLYACGCRSDGETVHRVPAGAGV
jgi:hypothetical protein